MENILNLLPETISSEIRQAMKNKRFQPQEIRLRMNQPVELNDGTNIIWLFKTRLTQSEALLFLNRISEYSMYRLEEELRQGYITISGGHRIGISGEVIVENGSVKAIKHVSSFNIRLATDMVGFTKPYLSYIYDSSLKNSLIIGPPQSGKTTFLRDIARYLSGGGVFKRTFKTAIVDERSEICASVNGVPQHHFHSRVDVMDKCPKSEGMMMLVRSMSPEVIIVDEIGSEKDVQALMETIHAGVCIICTVHGRDLEEVKQRPALLPLFRANVFDRFFVLSNQKKAGDVTDILDQHGRTILKQRVNSL
ncbi:stage III sporulation protein AA [Gracilibacillus sp. YIM 98692]|uniref:stage III sporulation protein AA n=1 Tax=Gracilibacillus sp. YIM 98692 TaxID=2663532 RepID=UPI0013D78A6C|nr:stage III sporulation protein AA [Gracilibacillus sp. YIM 98692]